MVRFDMLLDVTWFWYFRLDALFFHAVFLQEPFSMAHLSLRDRGRDSNTEVKGLHIPLLVVAAA